MTQTQEPAPATPPAAGARSRTFSWTDPASLPTAALSQLSGLDQLRSMTSGEVPAPPVLHMLGLDGFEVEAGRAVALLTPQEFHYNALGTVHGGVLSMLLDTAAGSAVHSVLPAGTSYTSIDLNVKFLRPVTLASGTVRCEGTVVQRGRRTAYAEAKLTDAAGRLAAHATSSCLLFELPPPS
ncbi:PaaI family thioesterase [Solwaraspora sp. WMMB335]|uniref:PaaI family thioesterase n=1 Tax=Solwaraspora sp. WMMB335 TaxID=3404118 RepID=UPI003B96203C